MDEGICADRTLRLLIDASREGIAMLSPSGTIGFCNRSFAAMCGADGQSIVGTPIATHLGPGDGMSWPVLLAAPARDLRIEMTLFRSDGTAEPVDVVVSELDVGSVAHCALFIAERAPARERQAVNGGSSGEAIERDPMEEALRQAQRMLSVGHLTGGIAHDFNNLLTVIGGNAELLTSEKLDEEVRAALARSIQTAAERGVELTQRLLSFARQQVLRPVTTDVNRLARGMGTLLRRALGENIELELALHDRLWPAFADPGQLEMAILNLAVNARDAMPGGGRLTIATANVVVDDTHLIVSGDLQPGHFVMVTVADTGVGMSPALVARAFEPFFTTKRAGKGSGLGLAMVYGFVKQSGGHVAIDSVPGEGTRVKLYLPRSDKINAPPADEHLPEVFATARPGERILFVEDDPMVRRHAETLLRLLGYDVVTADDGPSAVVLIEGGLDYDLLLTDVVMPGGMTGCELAAIARRRRPGVRVLYVSGYPLESIIGRAHFDAADELLAKPYANAALASKLREVLDRE